MALMTEEEFKDKMNEWLNYEEHEAKPYKHIEKLGLKLLYVAIDLDPDGVLAAGEYLLQKTTDPIAVLEAMKTAAQHIITDVEEHPDHDGATASENKIKEYTKKINELKSQGQKSQVYEIWKKSKDEE